MDELVVGRVLEVSDHPGARGPSLLLRLDLGPRGERKAQMEPGDYAKDGLAGMLVIVSIAESEAIVLAARSHEAGPVLVRPEREVTPGTLVA